MYIMDWIESLWEYHDAVVVFLVGLVLGIVIF